MKANKLIICMILLVSLCSLVYATDHVVISELGVNPTYGNDTTDYGKEYIELYNPTDATVDIGSWYIKFKGRPSSSNVTLPTNSIIKSHGYYLIADSGGNGWPFGWNRPDLFDDFQLTNSDFGIRLIDKLNNQMDAVGWGDITSYPEYYETQQIGNPRGGYYERKPGYLSPNCGNWQDTNNNFNDFLDTSNPEPQNSSFIETPCNITDTTPPSSITNLHVTNVTNQSIKWVWNNPTDPDFFENIIYINGVNELNATTEIAVVYNLIPDTEYTITIHTKDSAGNINDTDVSDTVKTLANLVGCLVDSDCNDNLYCNGQESCDSGACKSGTPVNCDDGLYCNGLETCNENTDDCNSGIAVNCSAYDVKEITTCINDPDNNPFTWDYSVGFRSGCDEENDKCTTETIILTHTCNKSCGAECETDTDCVAKQNGVCNLEMCTCEYNAYCGDNIINQPSEECDGTDLAGKDCTEYGYISPYLLSCLSNCSGFNTSSCEPVCGNNVIEPGEECDDGNLVDNDVCSSTCKKISDDDLQINYLRGKITFDGVNAPAGTSYLVEIVSGENIGKSYEGEVDDENVLLKGDGNFDTNDKLIFSTGDSFRIIVQGCNEVYGGKFKNGGNGDFIDESSIIRINCLVPPIIHYVYHSPAQPTEIQPVIIYANVTDNIKVDTVVVNYTINSTITDLTEMNLDSNVYSANLGIFSLGSTIKYKVVTNDSYGNYATSDVYTIYIVKSDLDLDGIRDAEDNCPLVYNPEQKDNDADGAGDVCDEDDDNDSIPDSIDNCPFVANPDQANNDGDSEGDICDLDDDNDGVPDVGDDFPFDPSKWLFGDIDSDGNVDISDLIVARNSIGTRPGDPNWNDYADANNDGVINILDLIVIRNRFT